MGRLELNPPHDLSTSSARRLADVLRACRDQIVRTWEATVRAMPHASALDRPTLLDHIPDLLERIAMMTERLGQGDARALAEQIAGAFAEFEGLARGNPKLRAGRAISLGLVKDPFDGKYTVTSTRHCYDARDGYTVRFTASGRQERSLFGLTSGSGSGSGTTMGPPIYGVVPALVTDVNDPENLGRVKLKFPWLSDSFTTDWARTVQLAAGSKRGGVFVSEVNDEVLVAFEQGDVRRPYVIGGLYNGMDKPDLGDGLVDGGAVVQRSFVSKKGHRLVFNDDSSKSGVTIRTGDGNVEVTLDASATKVIIKSTGDVEVKGVNIKVEASSSLELKGGSGVTIDGGPSVKVTGGMIQLN